MRTRFPNPLKFACVGVLGAVVGFLVGSRASRPPSPLARSPDPDEMLDRNIPEIDLDAVPFDRAVEVLQKAAGVRVIVRWEALDAELGSVYRQTPITFRAQNVSLSRALSEIVNPLRDGWIMAGYGVNGDSILISTSDDLNRSSPLVRAYDVRDLLPGPQFVLEDLDQLIQFLHDTVDPDSCHENGGTVGRSWDVAGRLVITQTRENHDRIANLLWQIRRPPQSAPPPPTPDLKLWDERLKHFVSTNPEPAEASLRKKVPEVRLDAVPLESAVASLAEQAHADVVADWATIRTAGWRLDTPVTLHLHDATLSEAIRALLQTAGAEKLVFGPEGGHVLIAAPDQAARLAVTRAYDFGDCINAAARNAPPRPPTPPQGGLFSGSSARSSVDLVTAAMIEAVVSNIDPRSWVRAGGAVGRATALNGWLIVTQSWENQEKVADLLAALRSDPARIRAAMESNQVNR